MATSDSDQVKLFLYQIRIRVYEHMTCFDDVFTAQHLPDANNGGRLAAGSGVDVLVGVSGSAVRCHVGQSSEGQGGKREREDWPRQAAPAAQQRHPLAHETAIAQRGHSALSASASASAS